MISSESAAEFIKKIGITDFESFIGKCEFFRRQLMEENRKYNLTRITSDEEFWIKHVADSISIAMFFPEIKKEKIVMADIGCGAGFPSVILASAFEKLSVFAIESSGKKADFANFIAQELKLTNFAIVNKRAREMSDSGKWNVFFDIITARAVKAETVFRETRRMLKKNGKMIFYNTPADLESKLCEIRRFSEKSQFRWDITPVFSLPMDSGRRLFIYGTDENIQKDIYRNKQYL